MIPFMFWARVETEQLKSYCSSLRPVVFIVIWHAKKRGDTKLTSKSVQAELAGSVTGLLMRADWGSKKVGKKSL